MYILTDSIIIANALYAYAKESLTYEEIEKYKKILYKIITEENKYNYVMFKRSESNTLNIEDHTFIKMEVGVQCEEPIDKEFIESINSIYPKNIRDNIRTSHNKVKKLIVTVK